MSQPLTEPKQAQLKNLIRGQLSRAAGQLDPPLLQGFIDGKRLRFCLMQDSLAVGILALEPLDSPRLQLRFMSLADDLQDMMQSRYMEGKRIVIEIERGLPGEFYWKEPQSFI